MRMIFAKTLLASSLLTILSLPAVASPTTASVSSAAAYNSASAYVGGSIVAYQGKNYHAKWYAEPGQSPADVAGAAEPWLTPWELFNGPVTPVTPVDPVTPVEPVTPVTPVDPGQPLPTVVITQGELDAVERQLTDFPLMLAAKASIATRDNGIVEAVTAGGKDNPENVRRVEGIVPENEWEFLFPVRAPEYTYRGFLQAVAKFPAFCGSYDDGRDAEAICRKSLATMFAHFAQETGGHDGDGGAVPEWRQALVHVREMNLDESMRGLYNGECNPATWQGKAWPCGTFGDGQFKSYFGRGAKQLSYNYNYGPFSEAMYGDVRPLLDHPEKVADTWLNLASAVFFFVYPQPPKPSMLHVVDGTWVPNDFDKASGLVAGFGVTTQIINGGVECGGSNENQQSLNRIKYYHSFANHLKVPVATTEVLGCAGMKQFGEGGAGALSIAWEQDWNWNPDTVGEKSYKCQLVGYQTPFSALKKGDYAACVKLHFPNVVIDPAH